MTPNAFDADTNRFNHRWAIATLRVAAKRLERRERGSGKQFALEANIKEPTMSITLTDRIKPECVELIQDAIADRTGLDFLLNEILRLLDMNSEI